MTNAIPSLIQSAQYSTNWTVVLSVCAVCLTAMTTFINIFKSKKSINDDELRESNLIKDMGETSKESKHKQEEIKDIISLLKTDVEKIKIEQLNTSKSMEELRRDNRELVQRLDDLLRQLLELLGS